MDALHLSTEIPWTASDALQSPGPANEGSVPTLAGRHPVYHTRRLFRPGFDQIEETLVNLLGRSQGGIAVLHEVRDTLPVTRGYQGVEKHQALDPLWKIRREKLPHGTSLGDAEEMCLFPTHGAHDSPDVFNAL